MRDDSDHSTSTEESEFSRQVRLQSSRKLKSLNRPDKRSIWFGLGISGLVGWSVTVPTLIGIAVGVWLDQKHPGKYSWTLMLLFTGLFIGCLNAWHWVDSEFKDMHRDQDD